MENRIKVFFATPRWDLSGVNTMTARLAAGLARRGVAARILLTASGRYGPDPLPPADVPYELLSINHHKRVTRRWEPLIGYLTENSPCVFVPNYDWEAAMISPALPSGVGIVGTMHSDDPLYYEQAERLGRSWNRIITVSRALKEKTDTRFPHLAGRTVAIPNGVDIPPSGEKRAPEPDSPLRIVYTGRVAQRQKRIFDLVSIAEHLSEAKFPFILDVAGDGEDLPAFAAALAERGLDRAVRAHGRLESEELNRLYREAHVFLLPSEFEGMSISLLEAMAWGCVPVCTRTPTGAAEVIESGTHGILTEIGDTRGLAAAIRKVADPTTWTSMSGAARARIVADFSEERVDDDWAKTIASVQAEVASGEYRRAPGEIRHAPGCDPLSVFIGRARVKLGGGKNKVTERLSPATRETARSLK